MVPKCLAPELSWVWYAVSRCYYLLLIIDIYRKCHLVLSILVCRFAGRDFGSDRGRFGGGSKSSNPGAGLVKPQWDLSRLPKFEKHFYKEHPLTVSRSPVYVAKYCIFSAFCFYNDEYLQHLYTIMRVCDMHSAKAAVDDTTKWSKSTKVVVNATAQKWQ